MNTLFTYFAMKDQCDFGLNPTKTQGGRQGQFCARLETFPSTRLTACAERAVRSSLVPNNARHAIVLLTQVTGSTLYWFYTAMTQWFKVESTAGVESNVATKYACNAPRNKSHSGARHSQAQCIRRHGKHQSGIYVCCCAAAAAKSTTLLLQSSLGLTLQQTRG